MSGRRHWALRGATTVERDAPALIASAVTELLDELVRNNDLSRDAIVSAHFTVTHDLRSEFPARAARVAGWGEVPMLSTVEIPVTGSMPRCIRVLMHVEFAHPRTAVTHVYLRGTRSLRPDLYPD